MSVDGETKRVMKGVQHGACDYLLKPIRMKELKIIWQHVLRKKLQEVRDIEGCYEGGVDWFTRNDEAHFLGGGGEDVSFGRKRKSLTLRRSFFFRMRVTHHHLPPRKQEWFGLLSFIRSLSTLLTRSVAITVSTLGHFSFFQYPSLYHVFFIDLVFCVWQKLVPRRYWISWMFHGSLGKTLRATSR